MPFDLFPDDADELHATPDLFTDRNGVGTYVPLLPQTKGGYAAGILEPPLFGWLLVTGEVMGSLTRAA